eukprot:TRINITY_DN4447_c0_g1_i1.p1 TRINITY_DN4447_c0_g1~~TRINITY_DN4447_c0_g1_i1.p1  ORF type:complete len:132 (-),score=20.52 TRINITY_DN4447_c0_g1_i1:229-594(-)
MEPENTKYASVIEHEGDEKYIVVKITGADGSKRLMIVSYPLPYHSHIASKMKMELLSDGDKLEIFGGGLIKIDHKKKHIHTYGRSGGYGPAQVDQVRTILENSKGLEGYTLDVTVTDYIRD